MILQFIDSYVRLGEIAKSTIKVIFGFGAFAQCAR